MYWCAIARVGLSIAPDMAESKVVIAVDNSVVRANKYHVCHCNSIEVHPLYEVLLSLRIWYRTASKRWSSP